MIRFVTPIASATLLLVVAGLSAQEVDNTQTLPQARPGECYAKVITPARFETRTEEVLVREASERIEAVPAVYGDDVERVLVREESRVLEAVEPVYETVVEQVETRSAELRWMAGSDDNRRPASPAVLQGLTKAGIELDSVKPQSCFREYYTEARYETDTIDVLVKEASERIVVSEAVYETVEERVLVKEESTEVVDVPAVYRIETQSVLVEPARSVWKQGRGLVERIDNSTGEILCLVEVPARYETITKTVLDKPATTKTVTIPAEYQTYSVQRLAKPASEQREAIDEEYTQVEVQRKVKDAAFVWLPADEEAQQNALYTGLEVCLTPFPAEHQEVSKEVLKTPASVKVTEVPAEYDTIPVKRVVSAASEKRIPIPRRTRTVSSRVQVEPSRLEWRKVLCETNITRDIILNLQNALEKEGFDPGPVDGVLGQATMAAVEAYQLDRELDRGGLTYETLESLNVKL